MSENEEDQCYLRDGELNAREVGNGTLKLRLISLDYEKQCSSNVSRILGNYSLRVMFQDV